MATYTKNLNLKKPAQEDFYNVDDFNENFQKLDDDANNHQLKTYTDLSQIGLTLGSETIENIVDALPENSMLFISVGAASNKNIYPAYTTGARYGVLRVTKRGTDRILFEFFHLPDASTQYTRYWRGLYSVSWYGWVEDIASSMNVAKIEMVSYVGTGTYGVDNPTVITFNTKPTIIIPLCYILDSEMVSVYQPSVILPEYLPNTFPTAVNVTAGYYTAEACDNVYAKWDDTTNSLSFYSNYGPSSSGANRDRFTQANVAGCEYFYIGITV